MKITAFHPSHFSAISPPWFQREIASRVTPEYLANLAAEPAKTLWIHERPVAIAGVLGNCELWSLIDERIRPYRFTLARAAREFLSTFEWLYANVDGQYHEACRWLEHLNFERVGIRARDGRHIIRYERKGPWPPLC